MPAYIDRDGKAHQLQRFPADDTWMLHCIDHNAPPGESAQYFNHRDGWNLQLVLTDIKGGNKHSPVVKGANFFNEMAQVTAAKDDSDCVPQKVYVLEQGLWETM